MKRQKFFLKLLVYSSIMIQNAMILCWIWRSHSHDHEELYILSRNTVWSGCWFLCLVYSLTSRKLVAQSAATCSRWFLTRGLFYPENRGDTFLRNVSSHKIYTASHPRRRHTSWSPLWKSQILHLKYSRRKLLHTIQCDIQRGSKSRPSFNVTVREWVSK
jgi:hypothetical protein